MAKLLSQKWVGISVRGVTEQGDGEHAGNSRIAEYYIFLFRPVLRNQLVDSRAKNHFDAALGSLEMNARPTSFSDGTPFLGQYRLNIALADLTRGIFYALLDLDARLALLEKELLPRK